MTRHRPSVLALVLAAVLCGAVGGPAAARGPGVPECAGPETTDTAGLVGDAQPVVLVHGWVGTPLTQMRTALEDTGVGGYQYLLYDYAEHARHWADYDPIHDCLAQYVVNVSEAHRAKGGSGLVQVVGHSMGGLAARFAALTMVSTGAGPVLAGERIGGVITVDTPHLGSAWGDGAAAALLDAASFRATPVPATDSAAWHCLARHDEGTALPGGCVKAPYVASGTRVHQIDTSATIQRTVFGAIPLLRQEYAVGLSSDGVVDDQSQVGYAKAGPEQFAAGVSEILGTLGARRPTTNAQVTSTVLRCTTSTDAVVAASALLGPTTPHTVATGVALVDWANMGALASPTANAYTASLLLSVAWTDCGHMGTVTAPATVREVLDTLESWRTPRITLSADGIGSVRSTAFGPTGSPVGTPRSLDALTRLLGRPDEVVPGGGEFCDQWTRVRWGDLTVLVEEVTGSGYLDGWAVAGRDLPPGVEVPFDLFPGQSIDDAAATVGLTPTYDEFWGWQIVTDDDGVSWVASTYPDEGNRTITSVNGPMITCE